MRRTLTALLFFLSSAAFAGDLISSSSHRVNDCNSASISARCGSTALAAAQPPYDASAMRWTFDPQAKSDTHNLRTMMHVEGYGREGIWPDWVFNGDRAREVGNTGMPRLAMGR